VLVFFLPRDALLALYILWSTEATVVEFCTPVGHIKFVVLTCPSTPSRRGGGHVTSRFWEISDNISEMVEVYTMDK